MKSLARGYGAGLVAVAMMMGFSSSAARAGWEDVDKAMENDQPRTAVKLLGGIEKDALAAGRWAEASKAIALAVVLDAEREEGEEHAIKALDKRAAEVPAQARPVLRLLQARWMHNYHTNNRWRFSRRSALAGPPGEDFTAWDLGTILADIDRRYQEALAALGPEERGRPVSEIAMLLDESEFPEFAAQLRPTVYDFLVHSALEFYQAEEVAASRPQQGFRFGVDSPAFADADAFLAWKPSTEDTTSPAFRAMALYQDLLRFHAGREEAAPRLHADLHRLKWAGEAAGAPESERREALRKALEAHVGKSGDTIVAAEARHHLASLLMETGDRKSAHAVAKVGAAAGKDNPFAMECGNLMRGIEARQLSLSTEMNWTPAGCEIRVDSTNLEHVFLRVYPLRDVPGQDPLERRMDDDQLLKLLAGKPAKEWDAVLEKPDDFSPQTKWLAAPQDLEPGVYLFAASANAGFIQDDNVLGYAVVRVTRVALSVTDTESGIEGVVTDARTGDPLAGVAIGVFRDGKRDLAPRLRSDANGLFRFKIGSKDRGQHRVEASNDKHRAVVRLWTNPNRRGDYEPWIQSVWFTDRSIYRPGQTVHFKGVLVRHEEKSADSKVVAKRTIEARLTDPNGQVVEKLNLTTNERGGFSGTFTAPTGGLMGYHSLQIEGIRGGGGVRVEEYKRPKFFVEVAPPESASKLGGEVTVKGRAESYTGAAVDAANVSWRVVRRTRFPDWLRWCGWWPIPSGESEEIANGTAVTAADGGFVIAFAALPDPTVDPKTEPVFDFEIIADVTDAAGETRSHTRIVRVAYTTLQVALSAPEWIEANNSESIITVRTTSHDGEARVARGELVWHRLVEPESTPRPRAQGGRPFPHRGGRMMGINPNPESDPGDPNTWELGEAVHRAQVETDKEGKAELRHPLPAGLYRLVFSGKDDAGTPVSAFQPIQVLDPEAASFPTKIPFHIGMPSPSAQPGDVFRVLWGSGYEKARALVVWHEGTNEISREWSREGATQQVFSMPVTLAHHDGLTVTILQFSMNRLESRTQTVSVPWKARDLDIVWESFRSKLEPGERETWTAIIRGPDGATTAAEMVATLYDASLDAFAPHSFTRLPASSGVRTPQFGWRWQFGNSQSQLWTRGGFSEPGMVGVGTVFPGFLDDLDPFGFGGRGGPMVAFSAAEPMALMESAAAPRMMMKSASAEVMDDAFAAGVAADEEEGKPAGGGDPPAQDAVPLRANLNETAFFFPHLTSEEDGAIRMEFTMPEALTKWRFLGMAHDANLRSGLLTGETVTAKELMVVPNPPRFLREGDTIEFTVRVLNQSDKEQSGSARLNLLDARTRDAVGEAFGLDAAPQAFTIPAKESRTLAWKITVPDNAGFLVYQASATAGAVSDGEEGWLPVLPRRVLATDSLALPIRGPGTRDFVFTNLRDSADSDTLRHQFLDVQVVSQPAWYAVMALPYLMEFPHDCAEQVFSRYYANLLARHIANSDPKIRRVFEQWKGTEALDSPLLKNDDLKGILAEETPWLRDGQDESAARRRVALLFDENHTNNELRRSLQKLRELQLGDGMWPWFSGGRGNEFITLHIVTGFARLRHLGVGTDITPALRALPALDASLTRTHQQIIKAGTLKQNHFSPWIAHHLYTRSFFIKDRAIEPGDRAAFEYFTAQAKEHWASTDSRIARAHAALALHRLGESETARLITRSLRENAVIDEELGMFWKDRSGWFWWEAPIEAQAMMIEAFRGIDKDEEAVDLCQVWLLKQKQTQNWPTTKSTADAVHALLLGGANQLASDALVGISLAGQTIRPDKVEAGTGFYRHRIPGAEITPEHATIRLEKTDKGVSWASVHWQYMEDIAKIPAHDGTPLKLEKQLYVRRNTSAGPKLEPLGADGKVRVGDELVTRVTVRTDRAMEFIHLKDYRGSGTEPVNVLSGYRWQDGLGFYEVTRDTATHFFLDYLPPGTHVFESSVRVQHVGSYPSGHAEIRCMYAPEFNARAAAVPLQAERQ